jgi:simple sugar transport system ATP-binding protein
VHRFGFVDRLGLTALTEKLIGHFHVKARGPAAAAQSLSGGNLQKFIVGREIDAGPRVLVVSQPTWGVDVGASSQIRAELMRLRDNGCALLVLSEELDELFELCDYLVVMAGGRLSPRIATADAETRQLGEWMSGLWPGGQESRRASPGALHAPA